MKKKRSYPRLTGMHGVVLEKKTDKPIDATQWHRGSGTKAWAKMQVAFQRH